MPGRVELAHHGADNPYISAEQQQQPGWSSPVPPLSHAAKDAQAFASEDGRFVTSEAETDGTNTNEIGAGFPRSDGTVQHRSDGLADSYEGLGSNPPGHESREPQIAAANGSQADAAPEAMPPRSWSQATHASTEPTTTAVAHPDVMRVESHEQSRRSSSRTNSSGEPPSLRTSEIGRLEEVPRLSSLQRPVVLLYGLLDVWVYEAENLPNMDLFSERVTVCLTCCNACRRPLIKAEDHLHRHQNRYPRITSDPYVTIMVQGGATLARTRVIKNREDPVWQEHFIIHVAHFASEVVFVVKDDDLLGAQLIGVVKLPAEQIVSGTPLEGWYPVLGPNNKPVRPNARLRLSLKYSPVEEDPRYRDGVGGWPKDFKVLNTYFPLRRGGAVRLYQDAHVPKGMLPPIELEGRKHFEPRGYWDDLCQAILEAHHLVYIVGWSIYDKVRLMRDHKGPIPDGSDLTLGELLKWKSAEGVRVLLLVWDDKTSHSTPFFNIAGVMGTHDEETQRFFKHTAVRCVLSPRHGDRKLSWFKQQTVGTLYTHHQKQVIVDSQGPGNNRKLTAFIGGMDLCDGRYDTPRHSLFETLQSVHKDDYHNPTFSGSVDKGGPRQPWHDLHSRIDGPAAYDALINFEQRWKKTTRWYQDALIQIERISWILGPAKPTPDGDHALMVTEEDDRETWHVQVFRSIDSGSVRGFPKDVLEAEKQNLVCGKDLVIELSIQTAYIEVIRAAQHFLYIENQYFLGSSYAWPEYKNAGATHLIPMEIALKLATKIKAGERFAVYIVIPMWPEGAPDSASVQEILFFQGQTMQMMYKIVADAIQEAGLDPEAHPKDYLNFYCLGNRESKKDFEEPPANPPSENTSQWSAQKNRRFMIYVHSKGMIVDDEYVILGSANINQRSMDGARDTELAVGAYQPHHTWARKKIEKLAHPRGQVYGYRMSLWTEHLGALEDIFLDPSSLDCVHRVNEMAEEYWRQYTGDEIIDMKGHLLPYPIKVDRDGTVGPLPQFETFPDVGGKVLGTSSGNLPDGLTT